MPKELKIALKIWAIILIPDICFITFNKPNLALWWILVGSIIGGIYAYCKDLGNLIKRW